MRTLCVFLLLCACINAEDRLVVGSKAPPLDIEHWLNKEPVPKFEKGKVYVIEFWATWCGPCVGQMPHLAELQEHHADDLFVIGISGEDPDTIDEFLERDRDGKTYREITAAYWLASDPDGSVDTDYMKASGMRGIPTAFVVGKTGEIEWIGHPRNIDQVLDMVIAGKWNRELAVKEHPRPAERPIGPVLTRLRIGDRVKMPVVGKKGGFVWGDLVYTTDSDPGSAAVHAGLLDPGEAGVVEFLVIPSPQFFNGVERNGVQSREWGRYKSAFIMRLVNPLQNLMLYTDTTD